VGNRTAGRWLYTDNFAYEPAGFTERTLAAALATALIALVALSAPFVNERAPVIAGFVPAVETAAIASYLFTASILYAQYRVRAYAPLAILALAFATGGTLHAVYLCAFPGVISTLGIFHDAGSAASTYGFARLGFALAVGAYVYAEWRQRRGDPVGRPFVTASAFLALLYVAVACTASAHASQLPPIMLADGSISAAYASFGLPLLLAVQLGGGVALVLVCTLSRRAHLWLTLAILGGMLDVFGSGFVSSGRFTYGWYLARADMVANAMVFLGVLHIQLAAILRRAASSGERAHLLYEIVALGSDGSRSSIDPMLARAARDLDFDWAFLVRVEGDVVQVETNISGGPFTAGFRTPLAKTLLRHAIERDGTFAVDDIAHSKWADDPSGGAKIWASFVAVPVHVDGAMYGAVGFAKARRREKPLNDADLSFVRLVGILAGSTIERARQRDHLDGLAFFDALTGLPNRSLLLKRIDQMLATAGAEGKRFALQFVDLDGFKSINDTYGHAAGDAALLELGRRLARAVRSTDTVARWGGDEFVILLPETERGAGRGAAEHIRAVFDEPFEIDGRPRRLGASIGVSRYPEDGATAVELLQAADRELYRAKADRALR
jgi:diguanylate cyclase (GGDEF)-like protein